MTQPFDPIKSFATNLSVSITDARVWAALAVAVIVAAVLLIVGTWSGRRIKVLPEGSTDGRTLAVGLTLGLILTAVVVAAVVSGGHSAFTPIAIGLTVTVAIGDRARDRTTRAGRTGARLAFPIGRRSSVGAAAFLIVCGLIYAATLVPSPSSGAYPIEHMDSAFYSILGRDLMATGVESWASPAGFASIPGLPTQMWYHWGELWLGGAIGTVFGIEALFARHLVALPMILLAAAALLGTLARDVSPPTNRPTLPFLLGALACLVLAPFPIPGNFFSTWPAGLAFSVTQYGLVTVLVLLLLHVAVSRPIPRPTWAQAVFVGTLVACVLPAHVLIAVLAILAVTFAVVAWLVAQHIASGTVPRLWPSMRRYLAATVVISIATACWGVATGHGLPSGGASAGVEPFNPTWFGSVVLVLVGAGVFVCIPLTLLGSNQRAGRFAAVMVTVLVALALGATAWGLRVAEFNSFHLFFGTIAVIAAPAAVVAFALVWGRAGWRARVVLLVLAVAQLQVGAVSTFFRLERFGPLAEEPIPESIVAAISRLPAGAKLGYQCHPLEEIAIWDPHFASIDAHTGRRVVSMCFQADAFAVLIGGQLDPTAMNPAFQLAPQRALFPDAAATPNESEALAFLRNHGVEYLFVDSAHANTLVPGARPIAVSGATQLLRVP